MTQRHRQATIMRMIACMWLRVCVCALMQPDTKWVMRMIACMCVCARARSCNQLLRGYETQTQPLFSSVSTHTHPFMTMLPRMKISPMVVPSAGTGSNVSGSATMSPSKTGYRTPCRDILAACPLLSRLAHSSCQSQTTAGP